VRFYRAKYLDDKYHKAAPLQAITWHIKSTESVKAGSIIIADDGRLMTAYKVSAPSFGMAGIYSYYLKEESQI
jgi:hypothetical protein